MYNRMKTIKAKYSNEIPDDYTGIVEFEYGSKAWIKNGLWHREDGPAYIDIGYNGGEEWWLGGERVWDSNWNKLNLRNKIILSKEIHPKYPTVKVLKYIDEYGIKEQIIIPGMEEYIIE